MVQDVMEVKRKEAAIVGMKAQIQELRNTLNPLNAQKDELIKRKQDIENERAGLDGSIQTCNDEKVYRIGKGSHIF